LQPAAFARRYPARDADRGRRCAMCGVAETQHRSFTVGSGNSAKRGDACYQLSPYATAKLYGYWITVNYRQGSGALRTASCSITRAQSTAMSAARKITRAHVAYRGRSRGVPYLRDLDDKREGKHARDYRGRSVASCSGTDLYYWQPARPDRYRVRQARVRARRSQH
jgi:GDP-D-mannose dehydratase